jgi:hypothetical protein
MRQCNDAALLTLAVTAHGHAGTAQQRLPLRMAVPRGLVARQISPGADVAGVSPALAAGLCRAWRAGSAADRARSRSSPPCARSADARGATRNMRTQQESAAVQREIGGRNNNPPRCNAKYADATRVRRGATRSMRTQQESAAVQPTTAALVTDGAGWPQPGVQREPSKCVCVCARALAYVCI